MGISSDSISLLFKAKGDTDDAKKAFAGLRSQVTSDLGAIRNIAGTEMAGAASSLASLASPALIAAGAIAAVGTAVIAAGASLFNFTKEAAEYSSKLFDAHIRTGLTAEAISALAFAAKISGSSLETVSGSVSKFNVLVGQAAEGNKNAIAVLQKYGVTSRDTTEAFNQAIETVGKMTEADQKATAARELWKDKTGQMLPVIDQLDGKFKAYIETAKKLGVTLSEQDLEAADKFGDTLDLLGEQARIAGVKFATELMPLITEAMNSISSSLAANQSKAEEWGRALANTIVGLGLMFNQFDSDVNHSLGMYGYALSAASQNADSWAGRTIANIQRVALAWTTLGLSEIMRSAQEQGEDARKLGKVGGEFKPFSLPGNIKAGGGKGGSAKAPTNRDEQKSIEADIKDQKRLLDAAEKQYKDTIGELLDLFKDYADKASLELGVTDATSKFRETAANILAEQRRLDAEKAALTKESDGAKRLREQEAGDRTKKVAETISDSQKKAIDAVGDEDIKIANDRRKIAEDLAKDLTAAQQKISDNAIRAAEELSKRLIEEAGTDQAERSRLIQDGIANMTVLLEAERERKLEELRQDTETRKKEIETTITNEVEKQKRLEELDNLYKAKALITEAEFQQELKRIRGELNPDGQEVQVKAGPLGFFGAFASGVLDYVKNATTVINANGQLQFSFTQLFTTIGEMGLQAFGQLAQGFGQMVANWVLYGNQGGNSLRKMFATVLSQIAQQATVLAIMCLAYAALATTAIGAAILGGTPGQFLVAAAIFGGVAAAAAIGGRLVAGNAFQQESSKSIGTAPAATGQGAVGRGGNVFSSQPDLVDEQGRNTPGQRATLRGEITLRIQTTKDHIVEVVKNNINNSGTLRTIIQDATS